MCRVSCTHMPVSNRAKGDASRLVDRMELESPPKPRSDDRTRVHLADTGDRDNGPSLAGLAGTYSVISRGLRRAIIQRNAGLALR